MAHDWQRDVPVPISGLAIFVRAVRQAIVPMGADRRAEDVCPARRQRVACHRAGSFSLSMVEDSTVETDSESTVSDRRMPDTAQGVSMEYLADGLAESSVLISELHSCISCSSVPRSPVL